jgi:uncharacterized membrane protein YfbV (UPF0208 family)
MPYVKKPHKSFFRKSWKYLAIGAVLAGFLAYSGINSSLGTNNLSEIKNYYKMEKRLNEIDKFYKLKKTKPKYDELKKIYQEFEKNKKSIEEKL